ncbi:MAG: indole-3-glycerol phosphate synthase TrpC, partial [Dehalococcoidia bacterium]
MILDEIIATNRKLLEKRKEARPLAELKSVCLNREPPKDAIAALSQPGTSLIAEVKRASPSLRVISADLDAVSLAKTYQKGGAAAISVLTETEYFKGSTADLEAVRQAVEVPVLRKDFTFDSYQVWEARAIGADMVLLIAAALPAEAMAPLYELVNELGMTPLIEVHNREELERVLEL